MATINWLEYENKNHVLAWLIVEAVSQNIGALGEFDSTKMEVELVINGVSYDVVQSCELLQAQLADIEKQGFKKGVESAAQQMRDNIDKVLEIDQDY